MLELIDVTKSFNQESVTIDVLHGINLTVAAGDYLAITGPSGSGKSTLMNIIGCLDQPTTGQYLIKGVNTQQLGEDQLAEVRNQQIGFVFQNFNLMPRLTALDNVALPLIYGNIGKEERKERSQKALDQVSLSDRFDFLPATLSGGQKQRVAIARALVTQADVILADEPTGALDSSTSDSIMALFEELNQRGKTLIVITHEPEIAACAKRQIVLKDGHIIEER